MDKLFGDLKGFFKSSKCTIDSLVFRLHYRFTLVVLIACSILVTGRQYLGDPIDCISRDDIPTELLDTYCWIHTTFSVEGAWFKAVGREVPYPGVDKHTPGERRVYHAYYQWVCFVLFLQALLFYAPRYLWKVTEGHRVQNLVMKFGSPLVRGDASEEMALLVAYLRDNMGHHLVYSGAYAACELLNFVNVVGQIYLTDAFLGGEFSTYGADVLRFTEWDWTVRYDPMIRVFPRMTKCTFHRYGSSGDVQKHDALCLLPINIMNEKIYVGLWFWFVALALLSALALLYRLLALAWPGFRLLALRAKGRRADPDQLRRVVGRLDRHDWLLLSLLCKNMSPYNFAVLVQELDATAPAPPPDEKEKEPEEPPQKV